MYGSILIGAKYWAPGNSNTDVGAGSTQLDPGAKRQDQLISPFQSIFTIAPESATYVAGLTFLKNISATAFKGASYLVNNSGESNITIGLSSGLPILTGYFNTTWNPYSSFEDIDNAYILKGNNAYGKPNIYLANLCSAKTDVFEPFDQQQLIWTGFYQSVLGLNIDNPQMEFNGKLYSYYTGAVSTNIFGGDTYIVRYGYRTTAQSHALTYFKRGINEAPGLASNNILPNL